MHTIQNNTILSRSNNTYWKSDIFLVKVKSALYWWNSRPLSLNEFQNLYKLYQGTAWINCKTNISTERGSSRVKFHRQNDQPRKNLDKLTIYFFFNRISLAFRWQTLSVSIFCESINKSDSLFDTQFILDLFFLFKQFQSHCFYKVFSYTKIRV